MPLALCGCLGGQLIGAPVATANAGSLQATPNSVGFGAVATGTTTSTTVSVVNHGTAAVNVSQISVSGQAFSASSAGNLPTTVAAGGTYSVNVNFAPAGMGATAGQLTISSDATTDGTLMIGLSGTGTAVSATPSPELISLSCAFNGVNGSAIDNCTVELNSAAANGGFAVSLSSDNPAVTVPASVTVAAGSTTASFTATVSPVSSAQTATLTAGAGGTAKEFSVQLNVAAAGLNIDASSIAFGIVPVNTTVTQSVELTASGLLPITIVAATVQGVGFSITGTTFPLTLTVGQPATVEVTFDPTAAGAATGQLIIVSTVVTNNIAGINLSGTGELAEVNLTWDAPSSSPDPVAGYNVYRAPSSGTSYQQLNSSVVTQTSYVDLTVACGQTYDYIVESVDASGITSAPSNMATVNTP